MSQTTIKQAFLSETGEGRKRLWLTGSLLESVDFIAGARYRREMSDEGLVMYLDENGTHKVSRKGRNDTPIIDILNRDFDRVFEDTQAITLVCEHGKVVVRKSEIDARIREREQRFIERIQDGRALQFGSLFHGGGILDWGLHEGFELGGLATEMKAAVELDQHYLGCSQRNNTFWSDDAVFINSPIQLFMLDQAKTFELDGVLAGIPCTGASISGRSKNGLQHAEDHEHAGALFAYFLQFVQATNPALVIMENVIQYSSTASWSVIKSMLNTMGYNIHYREMGGNEFGVLEDRQRMVAVAVSRGLDRLSTFDINEVVPQRIKEFCLADVLDDVPEDSTEWKPYDYLKTKAVRDKAAGKGFSNQFLVPEEAERVGTIGRGYAKVRSTEPLVKHPADPDLLRLLRPAEHARVKGIPEQLINGETSVTRAHEILGQSGIPAKFQALGVTLSDWARRVVAVDARNAQKATDDVAALIERLEQPVAIQSAGITSAADQLALFE